MRKSKLFIAFLLISILISNFLVPVKAADNDNISVPEDKYIFIETHENIKGIGDVGGYMFVDFPEYSFNKENGTLTSYRPIAVPPTKVIMGTGGSLSGTVGSGAGTRLTFYDTTSIEEKFYIDSEGTLHYFYNGTWTDREGNVHSDENRWISIKAGEEWSDVKETSSKYGGSFIRTYTVANYGFINQENFINPPVYLSGRVEADHESMDSKVCSGFRVECVETGDFANTDDLGYFSLGSTKLIGTKEFTLKISKPNYLTRYLKVTFNTPFERNMQVDASGEPIKMWAGDLVINGVQNEAINIADVMEVANNYNTVRGDARYKSSCDLNQDSAVNIKDIMIVIANFNKTSEDYTK